MFDERNFSWAPVGADVEAEDSAEFFPGARDDAVSKDALGDVFGVNDGAPVRRRGGGRGG